MNNQQIDNIFKDAQHELDKMPRNEVWHKLNNLLDEDNSAITSDKKKTGFKTPIKTRFKWWYAAAGLLLLLAPSLLFLNYFNEKTNTDNGSIAKTEAISNTNQTRSAAAKTAKINNTNITDVDDANSTSNPNFESESAIVEETIEENISNNNTNYLKKQVKAVKTKPISNSKSPTIIKSNEDILIKSAANKTNVVVAKAQKMSTNLAEDKASFIANEVVKKPEPVESEEFIISKNEEGDYEAVGDSNSKIRVTLNNNMDGAIAVQADEIAETKVEDLDLYSNDIVATSAESSSTKLKKGKIKQEAQHLNKTKNEKIAAVPELLRSLTGLWKNKTSNQKDVVLNEVEDDLGVGFGEILPSNNPLVIQKDAVQFKIISIDASQLPIRLKGKTSTGKIIVFNLTDATKKQLIFQSENEKTIFNKVLINKLSKKKIEIELIGLQDSFANTFIKL